LPAAANDARDSSDLCGTHGSGTQAGQQCDVWGSLEEVQLSAGKRPLRQGSPSKSLRKSGKGAPPTRSSGVPSIPDLLKGLRQWRDRHATACLTRQPSLADGPTKPSRLPAVTEGATADGGLSGDLGRHQEPPEEAGEPGEHKWGSSGTAPRSGRKGGRTPARSAGVPGEAARSCATSAAGTAEECRTARSAPDGGTASQEKARGGCEGSTGPQGRLCINLSADAGAERKEAVEGGAQARERTKREVKLLKLAGLLGRRGLSHGQTSISLDDAAADTCENGKVSTFLYP
jgi:hypothetical protein